MTNLEKQVEAIINDPIGTLTEKEKAIATRSALIMQIEENYRILNAHPDLVCDAYKDAVRERLQTLIDAYYKKYSKD